MDASSVSPSLSSWAAVALSSWGVGWWGGVGLGGGECGSAPLRSHSLACSSPGAQEPRSACANPLGLQIWSWPTTASAVKAFSRGSWRAILCGLGAGEQTFFFFFFLLSKDSGIKGPAEHLHSLVSDSEHLSRLEANQLTSLTLPVRARRQVWSLCSLFVLTQKGPQHIHLRVGQALCKPSPNNESLFNLDRALYLSI